MVRLEPATIQQQQLQPQCEQHPRARYQETLLDDSTDDQSTLDHQIKKFQAEGYSVPQYSVNNNTITTSDRGAQDVSASSSRSSNNHRIINYNNTTINHQGDTHTTTNQNRATPKHSDLDDMIRDDKAGRALRKARWERHYPMVEGEMPQEKSVDSDV
ncbi:hypothetical protein BGX30_014185 [Mortierella sp. GBA39]|nr:hypothetical protein BGX30_014185 [Mortierella sp. GBA39]